MPQRHCSLPVWFLSGTWVFLMGSCMLPAIEPACMHCGRCHLYHTTSLRVCTPRAQMHFEHSFCINCWYKDLDSPQVKHPPFVVHFAGCQVCLDGHQAQFKVCFRLLCTHAHPRPAACPAHMPHIVLFVHFQPLRMSRCPRQLLTHVHRWLHVAF